MKNKVYKIVRIIIIVMLTGFFKQAAAQSYCKPSFSGCSGGDSITYFSFGSFSASPGCLSSGYDTSGVKSSVITLYRGKTYGVLLQSSNYYDQFGIWIDYNKNGSYEDPAEMVGMDNNGNGTINQYSGAVTIPIDATPQVTRMRAMVVNGALTLDYDKDCNSWSVGGEAADYKITIAAYPHDIGLMVLNSPQNLSCPSSSVPVQVVLRNIGGNTETNIPISISYGTTTINATYKRTLISNTQDTFTVGYINASSNGTYKLKVYSHLTGDGDLTNDTINAKVDLRQAASPTLTNVNHCGPASIYLLGISKSGNSSTYWFNSATSTTPIANADSILLPFMKIGQSATYYAESRFDNTDQLTKGTWSTSRSNKGNFFDVFAKRTLEIDSFDVNSSASSTADSIFVYYRLGSYSGYERNAKSWTKFASVPIYGKGIGNQTRVKLTKSIPLSVGNTYGFYLVPYSYNTYYDTTGTTKVIKENSELRVKAGSSTSGLFTGISPGRDWDGNIFYHYTTCNSPRVSGTVTMLQNATGAGFAKSSPFMGSYNTGNKADPDQICMNDTNTYTLTPPTGMTNSDFGTKWVITAFSFATSTGTTIKDTIIRQPSGSKNGYFKFFPASLPDSVFLLKVTIRVPATGCDSTMIRYIRINAKPTAKFTLSDVCMGKVVAITNSSTPAGKLTFKWAFGNGDSANVTTPPYKYFSTGNYTVTLIAANGPCSATTTQPVTVYPSPYGSNFTKGFPFGGSMNTGDLLDPDNVCLTDTNTYQITAPKGLSNSDYGTKWTILNMSFGTIFGNKLADTFFRKPTAIKNAQFGFFPSKYVDSLFLLKFTIRTLPGLCDSVMTRIIHVRAKPSAYFACKNECFGIPLSFKDTSKVYPSSIVGWLWNFGDGTTSTAQNPTHLYSKAGKYNVTLTAFTDVGCPGSIMKTVEQYPQPVTKFGGVLDCNMLSSGFLDSSTIATGKISSWKWNFGDGSKDTVENPSHTYIKSGPYTVKLVISSTFGCSDSLTKKIRILPKPVALFTFLNACVGANIYTGNSSNDSAGKTVYSWNFGDGLTSTAQSPAHVYANNGTYKIALKITSGNGCTDTVSQTITPYVKPVPDIRSNASVCVGVALAFIDSGIAPKSSAYTWKFGDGSAVFISNKSKTASHSYTKSGIYTVNVNIVTPGGCADSQKRSITVVDFPKAAFSATSVCIGQPTRFTDASTGATLSFWDFGDGSKINTQINPVHTYSNPGSYTVKYGVANSTGCADSIVKSVTVNPLPVVGKWTRIQTGYTVTFIPQDSTIGTFKWYFGTTTNDSSSLAKPTFTYPTADGKYAVYEVITNTNGCRNYRIDTVYMGKYGINNPGNSYSDVSVFPNPFEGKTNITFKLNERSKVVIKVFDVQGKEVALLRDGYLESGTYTDTFDATKYKTGEGVYILKMFINDKSFTTRIVNMK